MAGHSKWKQIKEKKGKEDAKRSKEFSRLARAITVESRIAKGDVNSPGLRSAIERARASDMPKENIERAVSRGVGSGSESLEQITYETYGPGGVAILILAFTDSRNRTNQELKFLLSEAGYQMANPGSATWAFEKSADGTFSPKTGVTVSEDDTDKLARLVETLENHNDVEDVYTNAE